MDKYLRKTITNAATHPGLLGIDLSDVHFFLDKNNETVAASAKAVGKGCYNAAALAAVEALSRTAPWCDRADSLLVIITGGENMTVVAVDDVSTVIASRFIGVGGMLFSAITGGPETRSAEVCIVAARRAEEAYLASL